MLKLIMEFLGVNYEVVWSQELFEMILPVLIVVGSVLSLYMFISFFQFLYKLIKPKER